MGLWGETWVGVEGKARFEGDWERPVCEVCIHRECTKAGNFLSNKVKTGTQSLREDLTHVTLYTQPLVGVTIYIGFTVGMITRPKNLA